ncbi:hypothetical protein M422DRAFT_239218 [Sphaerobolus stellatus SS14]|nr:hypothetical protein M422DRAFT_239218 [Sphaerobolus stellatus SS14]
MASLPAEVDVLVVGAGPSGLATAVALKQLGLNFTIVDTASVNQNGSRSAIVHTRTLEVLDTIGLATRILTEGTLSEGERFYGTRNELITVNLRLIEGLTKFPFSVLIGQDDVERILTEKLKELDEHIYVNKRVVGYRQDHVTSIIVFFEDGSTINTRYIVGADGARSTIRSLCGIEFRDPFNGESYNEPPILPSLNFVLADAILQLPLPRGVELDRVTAFFDQYLFLIPLSSGSDGKRILCRVGLGSVEGRRDELPRIPTMEYLQNELNKRNPFDDTFKLLGITTGSRYTTRSALAMQYINKIGDCYIILVGDAAHVHTPLGGQGMNLGICDAVATAEAIRKHMDAEDMEMGTRDAILARFAERRREIGLGVIGMTQTFNYLAYWNQGWRRIIRNVVLAFLKRIPYVQRQLAMSISGLKNRD